MHQRAYELSLCFVGAEHPQLARTEFWPPDRQHPLRCDRNCKTPTDNALLKGGGRSAPLKLTSGVRALCLFFLQACGHARSQQPGEFKFEGGRGTPAGTLDQALGKDATSLWMEDMFGATKNGAHTHLYSLIDRLNPDLKKRSLPFSLQPKPRVFQAQKIRVYREGVEVKSVEELDRLIQALWNQWQPALPPYVSLTAPRHEGSSATSNGQTDKANEDDYQKHVVGLNESSRRELNLVAFADVLDCPAPTTAFRMFLLQEPLSSEIIYRELLDDDSEVLRFAKREVAELVLQGSCYNQEAYAGLLFEFTERCPNLTRFVFRQLEAFCDLDELKSPLELMSLIHNVTTSPCFPTWAGKVGKNNLKFLRGMLGVELTDLLQPATGPFSGIKLAAKQKSPLRERQFVTTASVWNQREAKYPAGTRITGQVRCISSTTLFIDLEADLAGMVDFADSSWSRKISHFSEAFKNGDEVEVVVIEVDKAGQRILLSLAQDTPTPA